MRVLIADKFEQSGRDGLETVGCQFSYQPDVKDDALVEAIRSYQPDALVVRSTKVTEPMLEVGALKLIVRAGAGYNTIDVAAASRRGVYVSNCPGKNSVAVAELALALILALDRRVADNVAQLREGRWNKKEFSKTRGLVGADFFAAMREGAYFVNTSRGEVVDQAALVRAMREKDIRAGLDVFANEPAGGAGEFTDEIAREPNLYGTHHIGASTDQAQEAIAAETVRIIKQFKETGQVPNVVNLARQTPATHRLVVRHLDRPGVLAGVLDAIKAEQINVQEMENIVFEGAAAAVARINLDNAPTKETLKRLEASNSDIIELDLLELQ